MYKKKIKIKKDQWLLGFLIRTKVLSMNVKNCPAVGANPTKKYGTLAATLQRGFQLLV